MSITTESTTIQVQAYPVPRGIRAAANLVETPVPLMYPDLMTEDEVIVYLRIPQVSTAGDYTNCIDNLIRYRDLPCIHICNKRLFSLAAVRQWIAAQVRKGVA